VKPPARAGILRVDKPEGPSSHDVVGWARKALGTRRVGHTGTLDPFASGLLLLLVGGVTRLSEALTGLPKTYEAEALLGVSTDTDDREGAVLTERPGAEALEGAVIDAALEGFLGPQLQRPPAFSAKKVGGEAAHRKARRGELLDLPPVPVEIFSIERLEWAPPLLRFRVSVSSGTYIRAIARDLGERLGVGGHLTALRRTRVGDQSVDGAVAAARMGEPGALDASWVPVREALAHFSQVDLSEDDVRRIRLGQAIVSHDEEGVADAQTTAGKERPVRVALFHEGELVALAEPRDGRLHPRMVMADG